MNIRKAFALKPYDYETIFASWPDAPIFSGNLKKDLAVDDWLVQIKQGCKARSVPKAIWHNVAQNYLKGKAKRRLEDVKLVMKKMHGGKYKWDWKKFKIAMIHMGWELKSSDTQGFKIGSIASGIWWIVGKVSTSEAVENIPASPEPPSVKYPFLLRTVKKKASSIPSARLVTPTPPPPPPKDGGPKRAGGDGVESLLRKVGVKNWHPAEKPKTTTSHVPIWLLNVTHALDALTYFRSEYPKTMDVISAVLITVGSIPTIPAVSAGAAGAVLAGETAKLVGAVAVGIGGWLKEGSSSSSTT